MAYLLGYLFADGSLENSAYMRGKYLRATSIDKDIIINMKNLLKSDHTVFSLDPLWPNGKVRYGIRIGNRYIYDSLIKLRLFPNKSLTMEFPVIPEKYLCDFVRGYFDGDGCVYINMAKGIRGQPIIKKLTIIFTSGSKRFLKELARVLQMSVGLNHIKIYDSHRSFQLRYTTADSVKLFKFFYSNTDSQFYLKRKFKIFEKYFKLRPTRMDASIIRILKN